MVQWQHSHHWSLCRVKKSQTLLGGGFLLELLHYFPLGGNRWIIAVPGKQKIRLLQINIQVGVWRKILAR